MSAATEWKPKVNLWIIAVTVSLAAFMEVLDTSIANVALPHMAGGLGVSNDESTWVLTSYLVSNVIVLPLSGYMVSTFGRKRFLLACIALFTLSSLLCGAATSLGMLLLFRVMQGAFGGGLQPMAQSILADSFPASKRGVAFSVYGITAVCAPAIGPTLGGWLTDNYSWRWVFYINIPVGILAIFLVQQLIEDPPYLLGLRQGACKFDFVGFSLLTIGVAALQIALDKGQEDDWFGSTFITTLIVAAAIGLTALIVWEWFQKAPVVDVRLFKGFNFAVTNVMFFVVGMILFSSTVLMPQFLQTLMGYTRRSPAWCFPLALWCSWRLCRRRPTRGNGPGPLPSGIRLGRAAGGHVCFLELGQSLREFRLRDVGPHPAVLPAGICVCSPAISAWPRRKRTPPPV
jgi:DHA2 family multidrug resistance protein